MILPVDATAYTEASERVNEHTVSRHAGEDVRDLPLRRAGLESGLSRFANAGHDLPMFRRPTACVELRARGMPLGLMPGMSY